MWCWSAMPVKMILREHTLIIHLDNIFFSNLVPGIKSNFLNSIDLFGRKSAYEICWFLISVGFGRYRKILKHSSGFRIVFHIHAINWLSLYLTEKCQWHRSRLLLCNFVLGFQIFSEDPYFPSFIFYKLSATFLLFSQGSTTNIALM